MKIRPVLLSLSLFALLSCQPQQRRLVPEWTGNPAVVNTDEEIRAEIGEKDARIAAYLERQHLDGILLTQVRNVYWITAGTANTQIVLNKDVGAASLLILRGGKKYVICSGSEGPRLMDESLGKLGYTLLQYPWYEANPVTDVREKVLRSVAGNGTIGSDATFPGTVAIGDRFKELRYSFTDGELKRYRWLGKQTTEAVAEVCRAIEPGMSEFEIEALTSDALRARGIMPTVLLIGADERIAKYRHALPAGAILKNYAMVNVVAEKWGMPVAVTRFVHFGPLPDELATKVRKSAEVMAHYEEATVPGAFCASIFEKCKQWYADAGYEGKWMKHHQGGAIGYDDREYVIYPGIAEVVQDRQPFAWNPTITGAKVEDTMIAFKDHCEVVTISDGWPMIDVTLNGKSYPQPGILVR